MWLPVYVIFCFSLAGFNICFFVFDFYWFDTIAALFIAGYLLWNAYEIGKQAIELLMDKELPEKIRKDVLVIKNQVIHVRNEQLFMSRVKSPWIVELKASFQEDAETPRPPALHLLCRGLRTAAAQFDGNDS